MILEVKDLIKSYSGKRTFGFSKKSSVTAVNGVSFRIEKGETLSLVGESGCGKTTLARMMMKLIKPTVGEISFEGEAIHKHRRSQLRDYYKKVQMVFQDPFSSLDPRYTIRHVLSEPMHLDKAKYQSASQREKRLLDLLEAVNLPGEALNRYPHEFSGGERQRIAIARSLVPNPKLLILDEAVSALDVIVQDQILTLLKSLQKRFDLTFLFISHDLKVVRQISDRIAVMYRGKIVEMAKAQALFENPQHPYTKELLSAAFDYKVLDQSYQQDIPTHASLFEISDDHFVIQK